MHYLVDFSILCIGPATNIQAKYDVAIALLEDALEHHVHHHCVFLDSQLLVMQLNAIFHVHNLSVLEYIYELKFW
jgi:hypothetical protein